MFPYHLLEDPSLKKNIRVINARDNLFQQGELGNTLIIIVEGTVALYQTTMSSTRLVDMATKGQVLGEKTVVLNEPYKRSLTAQAVTDVILLELDRSQIKILQTKLPDFFHSILRYVIERLDKANDLVGVLQLKDDTERLIHYLLYWARHNGKKGIQGVEFSLSAHDIASTINVEEAFVTESLRVLGIQKLVMHKNDLLLIPDENALVSYLPNLRERLAP